MTGQGKRRDRIRELEARLREAEETLEAVRKGEVDAFVVSGPNGDQVYTLKGADHPYRELVQDMHEGALTLSPDGLIGYSNRRFADLVRTPLNQVIGSSIENYVDGADLAKVKALLREGAVAGSKGEITLRTRGGGSVPVFLSFSPLEIDELSVVCLVVTDLTEQKRADEILAAETLARAILEQAAESVVVLDRTGKIVRASRSAAALAGDDILYRRFDAVFPLHANGSEDARVRSAHDLYAIACEGQTVKGVEAVLPRVSKPPAYLLVSAGPLRGPKAEPLGCVVTLTDITARRAIEEQLRVSEERRRLAVEAASVGTWNLDVRSRTLSWSRQCKSLFGLGPDEEVTFDRFLSLIHPEDRDQLKARAEKAPPESAFDAEYRVIWPDGSVHWISSRGRVEADASGQPVRIQGAVLNIDQRRRMEDELRQASETVNAIIAGAPVAVWLVDTSGKVALWNPAAERLFGYPSKDAVAKPGLFHLRTPSSSEILRRLERGEVIVDLEGVCERSDGSRIDVSLSTSVLHDAAGTARGFVALAADVTERRQLEEQIRQSQKLESIGLLAGGVAHDFNNLLVGIIGNASLLLDAVPADAQERLQGVIEAGERAANLTRQLLAYAGKGRVYTEAVDFSGVIRALLPLIRTSLPASAEIRLDLQEGLPAIECDRSQIEQVIMNLVINAGEAIGSDRGKIAIRTWAEDVAPSRAAGYGVRPGKYVCMEVADTGCGMDELTKSRAFDPFFTTKFTGRGLGLAAVQGIVRSAKGLIRVESQKGKGARFTVFLPGQGRTADVRASEPPASPPRGSGVVLVVDDEETVRSVAATALRRSGFTVVTAADGKEAVARLREAPERIDAVVLDVKMPVMDGREALNEMRRIRPKLKVLVSSGYNETEALREHEREGVAGFVQKPYRAAELAEAVRSVIESDRKARAGRAARRTRRKS